MLSAGVCRAQEAQTFQIGPDASKSPQAQTLKKQNQDQGQQLGWGTNIQNARIGRAAEMALQKGDRVQALDFAQRAVHAAPNDSQLWFLLGYAARLNSKFTESVEAYQHGLRLNPGSLEGTSGLAQDYSIMGKTDEAQRLLKQVVAADPRRRDDTLLLGETYMRARDYSNAVDWLERAERLKPDARSEVLLAISYEQLKRMDVANRYLDMARHHDPNNPDVQRTLAGYYRDVGKYDEAINALKSIRNPKPDLIGELAYTYELDGKMPEAAKTYARAANGMPKDLSLQLSAAQAWVAVGDIHQADSFLGRAAGIDPNYYRLHAIRAEIARIQDRDDEAVKEYSDAIAHLPAEPAEGPLYGIQLHVNLMQLDDALHDEQGAHQQLAIAQNQINGLDPQGASRGAFLRLRSVIKLSGGNLDGALADIKEALALNPRDRDDLQQNGDILMKMGQVEEAIGSYKKVLAIDPKDRFALTSLGYASRAAGRDDDAERYFRKLADVAPNSYVPYLALGDLYTARRRFTQAQASYSKAYAIAPKHALIMAGGMNAAIEAHNLNLAQEWLSRVTDDMLAEPQVLREKERYLSFRGDYQQSEQVAEQAIKVLPTDRDVVVYLGYDLLHLQRYKELLQLTSKYNSILPNEPDIPLLAGYVHNHDGDREQARRDFTEAITRDPKAETAYVNLGYVLNNLHQPQAAADDFEAALKLDPKDGEAHLGLAYASLDLHKSSAALRQAELAEQTMGDFRDLHLIRATAYGRQDMLGKAAEEYRAALKFTPNDPALHLGLGNTLFAERRYRDAIDELLIASKGAPENAEIDAMLARSYANLDDRNQALAYVQSAERKAEAVPVPANPWGEPLLASVYVSTGQALNTLGEQKAAMERFSKALDIPHSNRVSVRLAIAQNMSDQGHEDDAERQVALALMEAGTGETSPVTGNEYIQAADVFRGMHDYTLSQKYLERAKMAGAPDPEVRIGMANNYLAVGDTQRARAELDAVKAASDGDPNYQFLIAQANVFRQEHLGAQAMTSFAQASNAGGEDPVADQGLMETAGEEGWKVNQHVSLLSDFAVAPVFEDTTVYVLDSKLDATEPITSNNTGLLPPPRSSIQTQWTDAFHLHFNHMLPASGFFQVRNARGTISVPATNSIVNRSTTDSSLNFGFNPTIRLGTDVLTFDSGVQGTIRRDSLSPLQMNQNLFREFTYVSSSSFFNALSFSGYVIHEHGPFTETNLHSSQLTAALDFRVGAPWGKTTLVTGWGYNNQKFSPVSYQNFYTSSYVGLEHRFGPKLNIRAILEDVRAWRIVGSASGIAQNLRPAGTVDYSPRRNWDIQVTSAYSSTRSFHIYDATQNGFSVSYARPFRRKLSDAGDPLTLAYPLRFSAGMQEETFFNFSGGHNQLRPYVGITIF